MGLAARFDRLVPDLSATLLRFPVPAAISILTALFLNVTGLRLTGDWQVYSAAAAGFLASGAAHLFAEGRGMPRAAGAAIGLVAGALAAGMVVSAHELSVNQLFLFPGLIALVFIAGHLHRAASQEQLWLFALRLSLAVLLSIVVAVIFGLGLLALIETTATLFGVEVSALREYIWTTAITLIGPLYGLSLAPKHLTDALDIAAEKGTLLERGTSVLVNYIAVPVVAAYAVILHAYAAKILIDGALPDGNIAFMVTSFAIGGTAAWIVAWPWRNTGTWLLRQFMRFWFFLLIVPAIMLVASIWRRLTDYGITPDRYGIVLVAVWVALLVAYLAIRRNRADMRAIIGAGAVLLLAGSLGPWGANGLTATSQIARLAAVLEANGLLKDGKIVTGRYAEQDGQNGMTMLYALRDVDALERVRPWLAGTENDPFATETDDWRLVWVLGDRLGLRRDAAPVDDVSFNANQAMEHALPPGARLFGPFTDRQVYGGEQQPGPLTVSVEPDNLVITLSGASYRVAKRRILETVKAALDTNRKQLGPVVVDLPPDATMLVEDVSGNLGKTTLNFNSVRFWIIQRPQP